MNLERHIAQFVAAREGRGLLVALSGGPDSLALFHLLRRSRIQRLHVAHVDHRWRESSEQEAQLVQEWAGSCPFHLKTLDPDTLSGNLEDACRRERLAFFGEVCAAHNLEGVVLGHHLDDQVETILKRVLEGASLTRLGALQEVSTFEGLSLFRPLLPVRKRALEDWLYRHRLTPLSDPTNENDRFLRGRMRTTILPELERHFGKEVSDPLVSLGKEADALREHLDVRTDLAWKRLVLNDRSMELDVTDLDLDAFEMRYLLRRVGETRQVTLPRQIVAHMAALLRSGGAKWEGEFTPWTVYVDGPRCTWMKTSSSAILK